MEIKRPSSDLEALPAPLPPVVSTLPPPGNMHVRISLGKKLGSGGCSLVYTVKILSDVDLPPLVAKIARTGFQSRISPEASAYQEVEPLQGVVVPLCYGAFEGRLADGCTLDVDPKAMRYEEHSRPEFQNSDAYYEDLNRRVRDAANPERVCILLLERLKTSGLPYGAKLTKFIRYVVSIW